MPKADEAWLAPFWDAFFQLADYFGIQLIGGDTTKGPLCLTLTVQGFVPKERALTRHTAQVGDWIYVTGDLGDSRAGLDVILDANKRSLPFADKLEERHFISTPRVLAGQALLNIASAAIDISDGLVADLGHILQRSSVGASIDVAELPLSAELLQFLGDTTQAQQYALTSGEEYELCFTVPQEYRGTVQAIGRSLSVAVTPIGEICEAAGLSLRRAGEPVESVPAAYRHF